MPLSYQFLYRNIPLSKKQESLLTLSLCWEQLDAAKEINVLQFSETNTTPEQPIFDIWLKMTKSSYLLEKKENSEKSRDYICANPKSN